MEQPGLHGRHRDKNGEISRKHGNTLIGTLRKIYGKHFAEGVPDHTKLSDVLASMNDHSLSQLVNDHEIGQLHEKISAVEQRGEGGPHEAGGGVGSIGDVTTE
jgi:hypothetical protein